MSSARAIVTTLLLIGVSVYFIGRVITIISYSSKTYEEMTLEDIYSSVPDEYFILKDFNYSEAAFKRLDNKHSRGLALYPNENDSVSRIGIEIKNKQLLLEDIQKRGYIVVRKGGGLFQLPTRQGTKLFGYWYMSPEEIEMFKRQIGEDKFDVDIDRGTTLEYIPHENFSRNWKELVLFPILIIGLLFIAIISFRNARRSGQF
ncbi:MAG: hypothetical protein E6767_03990 [Dysgonomonas sp.]|nr:hypothetical protein [Dysgonomonas sp.]